MANNKLKRASVSIWRSLGDASLVHWLWGLPSSGVMSGAILAAVGWLVDLPIIVQIWGGSLLFVGLLIPIVSRLSRRAGLRRLYASIKDAHGHLHVVVSHLRPRLPHFCQGLLDEVYKAYDRAWSILSVMVKSRKPWSKLQTATANYLDEYDKLVLVVRDVGTASEVKYDFSGDGNAREWIRFDKDLISHVKALFADRGYQGLYRRMQHRSSFERGIRDYWFKLSAPRIEGRPDLETEGEHPET